MCTQDVLKDLHKDGQRARRMRNQTTHTKTHACIRASQLERKQATDTHSQIT